MVTAAARAACFAEHNAIRRDPARFAQLEYVGRQHTPADADGPAETIELRNCRCGSTLSVLVPDAAPAVSIRDLMSDRVLARAAIARHVRRKGNQHFYASELP